MQPQVIPHQSSGSPSKIDFLALFKSSHIRNSTENSGSFPQWLAQKAWQCCWLPEMQITRLTSIEIRSFISNAKLMEPSWNLIFILTCVKMHVQVWIRKITKLPLARLLWDIVFLGPILTLRIMGCNGNVGTIWALATDSTRGLMSNFFFSARNLPRHIPIM